MDERIKKYVEDNGFFIGECPYTPIHEQWEQYPLVKCIRQAEKELGIKYIHEPKRTI